MRHVAAEAFALGFSQAQLSNPSERWIRNPFERVAYPNAYRQPSDEAGARIACRVPPFWRTIFLRNPTRLEKMDEHNAAAECPDQRPKWCLQERGNKL
jgi:hypothetical protein